MDTWKSPLSILALLLSLLLTIVVSSHQSHDQQKASAYIVHVSKSDKPALFASHVDWYSSAIASVKGLNQEKFDAQQHGLLYAYDTVFHGFAAKLSKSEAEALAKMDGILSIMPDAVANLHTTRTPAFMGLNESVGLWPASDFGDEVIIGVMDSGIWPERSSFDDNSLGPVPERWKGTCEAGTDFTPSLCNNKLIGARAFFKGYESAEGAINETIEYKSARDSEGHGTHTSSTAAGNFVSGASLEGCALGTARGIATRARIAMYKVCWAGGCFNSDLLAAFEQAVVDGVDIISLSIGGGVLPYSLDPIAIGAFGAMEKGILVSCSAGNGGPSTESVTNVAPWLLTVAASTLDRSFPARVVLGNRAKFAGVSLYDGKALGNRHVELIYAGSAGLPGSTNGSADLCMDGTLAPDLVKGKIVVCDRGINARTAKGVTVKQAGGVAMILANAQVNGDDLTADSHVLPAIIVGYKSGLAIKAYIAQSSKPISRLIFLGTILGVKPAPVIASFSSRGPNPANPEILKPDITAPGVNILAAWTGKIGPSGQPGDNRVVDFNIISGTSMSCPHASGVAALLKGAHSDWSPAAIKSALMTTAYNHDNSGNVILDGSGSNLAANPFSYGSGHINPVPALNPGLIYDMGVQDYVDFLCSQNYTPEVLKIFTKGQYSCPKSTVHPADLNYPSLSLVYAQVGNTSKYVSTVSRSVTNVGTQNSVYTVTVKAPQGVTMKVEPTTLSFTRVNERQSYKVTFEANSRKLDPAESSSEFGSLMWAYGVYKVQIPVVFTWQNTSPL